MTDFHFAAGHLFVPVAEEDLVVSHQHNANQINTDFYRPQVNYFWITKT